MKIKQAVFLAVLVLAVAALAVPLVGLRAAASGSTAPAKTSSAVKAAAAEAPSAKAAAQEVQKEVTVEGKIDPAQAAPITEDTVKALGILKAKNPAAASEKIAKQIQSRGKSGKSGDVSIQSGEPEVLNSRSALSDALITTIGGRSTQFSEIVLLADWDGREDCNADREQKVDDFSFAESEIDFSLTRAAISEHTVANGFNENVYFYGDSVGNFWVGTDTNPGVKFGPGGAVNSLRQVNIPQLVNSANSTSGGFTLTNPIVTVGGGHDCTDDQVTVTGIAVSPVVDLGDFNQLPNPIGGGPLCGVIGEVVYVSVLDTEGCVLRAATNNPIRTRVFAFAFVDGTGAGALTPVAAAQIFTSPFSNLAGVSVDDDGSLYFQLVDLIQFTGGAIFKLAEQPRASTCHGAGSVNRFIPPFGSTAAFGSLQTVPIIPFDSNGNTSLNAWTGASSGSTNPRLSANGVRGTNFGRGSSTLYGDIVAITNGPCNVLYAAVSASLGASGVDANTTGLFPAPSQFGSAGTPSMVISFADCSGLFDGCTGAIGGGLSIGGVLPVADGFADPAAAGLTAIPGVNVFRVFVLGNGPDIRSTATTQSVVPNTPATVLKLDMQIDFTIHSGIAVSEEGTVFVISGGTPAGIGKNPSPMFTEILCFEDFCPADRRADFVDLRGQTLPNPPASGGNVGDGVSDRFDHIWWQAPIDQVTFTPTGAAGLARGFLRFTNRLAPNPISAGVTLGTTTTVLSDDSTSGQIFFENLDPGHQVAGGDDQNPPFRGDDDDLLGPSPTVNNPTNFSPDGPIVGPLSGGFEFIFGEVCIPPLSGTIAAAGSRDANGAPTGTPCNPAASTTSFSLTSSSTAGAFPTGGCVIVGGVVTGFTRSGNCFTLTAGSSANPAAGQTVLLSANCSTASGICINRVWNSIFWNSNGNITFGQGDTSPFPSIPAFRLGLPKIAAAWADLNPGSRAFGASCQFPGTLTKPAGAPAFNTFPVMALGFANVNAFKVRWINVPEFGLECCVGGGGQVGGASNTFSITLYDDGTGLDENENQPFSSNNSGNNSAPFDQQEGPTDLRFNKVTLTNPAGQTVLVGCPPRADSTGIFVFDFCRMDLLGTASRPVIVGFSVGGLFPTNPPGVCATNLSEASRAADTATFGQLAGGTPGGEAVLVSGPPCGCCIGEGTEPTIFELFNCGKDASTGAAGEITLPTPCFDLRMEGNDAALCTPNRQRDLNRQRICFNGISCVPQDICASVVPGTFVTTPTTTGIINSVCNVPLNIIGCGFFPNETTTICAGFSDETGIPLNRPGKVVTTAATVACDVTGAGVPTAGIPLVALTNVTPVSCNLITATLAAPVLFSTNCPQVCCGGTGILTLVTTFTAGDNNFCGPFTRTASCSFALGTRAPAVFSAIPSGSVNCAIGQDILISGACFCLPDGTPAVTSVTFVPVGGGATITASSVFLQSCCILDAFVNFTSANAGKTFLVFVSGPGGTSRNLSAAVAGQPCTFVAGNESGIQVTVTCTAATPPGGGGTSPTPAVITGCTLDRQESGQFFLDVTGTNIKDGFTVTVGGVEPKKVRTVSVDTGTNTSVIRLLKKICNGLPGNIVVTNPGGAPPSAPFFCNKSCPSN